MLNNPECHTNIICVQKKSLLICDMSTRVDERKKEIKREKKSLPTHLDRKAGLVVELLEVAFFGYWLALVRGKRADEVPVPGRTGDTAKTHTAYESKTMAKKAFIVTFSLHFFLCF